MKNILFAVFFFSGHVLAQSRPTTSGVNGGGFTCVGCDQPEKLLAAFTKEVGVAFNGCKKAASSEKKDFLQLYYALSLTNKEFCNIEMSDCLKTYEGAATLIDYLNQQGPIEGGAFDKLLLTKFPIDQRGISQIRKFYKSFDKSIEPIKKQ